MVPMLNPSTAGRLYHDPAAGPTLELHVHAAGKPVASLLHAKRDNPPLFEFLLDWFRSKGPVSAPPFDADTFAEWADKGLLLSRNSKAAFDTGPALDGGLAVAREIFPEAADLIETGICLNKVAPELSKTLTANRYAEWPVLFRGVALGTIRSWYRQMFAQGWAGQESPDSPRRVLHNDPIGRLVIEAMAAPVKVATGCRLLPTYSYAVQYEGGQDLPRHRDRAQCEYTVSIALDYEPSGELQASPWPIKIHTAYGDREHLHPFGGGSIFKGRELAHSRDPLPQGHTATMLFIHYVLHDFAGSLS